MNMIRRFLYGRNGPDQLALSSAIFGLLLSIVSFFVPVMGVRAVLQLVEYVCLVYFFFRVVSRNVYKRREENLRYLQAVRKIKSAVRLRVRMVRERKEYQYLTCPACGQTLRVPRGKGKIMVSCSKCRHQFMEKV